MSVPASHSCTSVARTYVCACTGKDYHSASGLRAHHKTQRHIAWAEKNELRDLKATLTKRENKIIDLEQSLSTLRSFNEHLIRELYTLRKEGRRSE